MKRLVCLSLFLLLVLSIFVFDVHGSVQSNSNIVNSLTGGQASDIVFQEDAQDKLQFGGSWAAVVDGSSSSGLAMEAANSSANGGRLFGPYLLNGSDELPLAGKPFVAVFRLKVTSNASLGNVVYIDVSYNGGIPIQLMTIKANNFALPNVWQDFQLPFVAPDPLTAGLEFRIINQNNGVTDVFADEVTVYKAWAASVLYEEGAY
ncbi:MAG: hypothetical protein LAN71_16695, partial [Acidobacteriia bacterium]|nr:hypothetical protein [Terriglobia bacterium]